MPMADHYNLPCWQWVWLWYNFSCQLSSSVRKIRSQFGQIKYRIKVWSIVALDLDIYKSLLPVVTNYRMTHKQTLPYAFGALPYICCMSNEAKMDLSCYPLITNHQDHELWGTLLWGTYLRYIMNFEVHT